MNRWTLAPWIACTIVITVTVNRIRANIARVIPVRNGRSVGYDIAIRAAGRPFRLETATRSPFSAGPALNTATRIPPRTRRRPIATNRTDSSSCRTFTKCQGPSCHVRFTSPAAVTGQRAGTHRDAATARPRARSGTPATFPRL